MLLSIYAVLDDDGLPVYIGATIRPVHLRVAQLLSSPRNEGLRRWMAGRYIEHAVLEVTNDPSREAWWIERFREVGCQLFNRKSSAIHPLHREAQLSNG